MALGKTGASAIAYTPFNKTSFGYGSGELAAAHSGLANVKVVITLKIGTNHWDESGHISTPSSGSAVASYNKQQFEWLCVGSVADVDGVLDKLDFFPIDFPSIRNWSTTALKTNATNGTYTNENPGDTVPIPDTIFELKVYDLSDGSLDGTYTVTFDPTQPTFGKQRPYWSVVPTDEDANTLAHNSVAGGLLDLGTVLQGSDTDPLTVTCEFRNYGTTTLYTGSAYGVFTAEDGMFIGDKKPSNRDTATNRLKFTGTKAEVQVYLDSVRYYNMGNETTFDMFFTITNGVVGSTLTKSIWFSDATIGLTTVPPQSYIEDTAAVWDFGALTTSNVSQDVDVFAATVTLDSTGISGADTLTTSTAGVTQAFNGTTGVLTISHSSEATLLTALRNLTFTPDDDFNSNFNMTVQLTYTGSAISSTYTSASQTVAVSGTATEDISNPTTAHTYVEDNVYSFSNGIIPQIIHYANNNFTVTFDMGVESGRLGRTGSEATFAAVGNGVYTLTGTRDQVNTDLSNLYYSPATDYNADHTITFTIDRTSGTGHGSSASISTGTFTFTGTPIGEYSITQLVDVVWEEDVNLTFDTGLQIIDTADEVEDSATFNSHYIVACELWRHPDDDGGSQFTDGTLEVVSEAIGSSLTIAGDGRGGSHNGQFGGNALTISGTKTEVNTAMQNLTFVPDPNYEDAGPWIYYYIQRVYDNVWITPLVTTAAGNTWSYPADVITKFLSASSTEEFLSTQTTQNWEENVTKEFDSGLEINDKVTENPEYNTSPTAFYGTEYKVEVWMTDAIGSSTTNYYTNGNLQTSTSLTTQPTGTGRGGIDFVMTGSKAEINTALTTMKFIPDVDYYGAGPIVWYKITRLHDSSVLTTNDASVATIFATNSATTNYTASPPTHLTWYEDQIKLFDSGIVITDKATENPDYGAYKDTTFTVLGRAKWWDGSTSFAMNSATWGCSDNGGASVSGLGTEASVLTITGTKAQVNIAMANLKMVPSLDWIDSDASNGSFWIEWNITRDEDDINYLNYGSDDSTFMGGTTTTPYFATVSGMAYTEDTPTKIFEGKDVGITETATADPLHLGNAVTYQVEVEISPNADGTWGATGSSTYVTSVGSQTTVNAELQALEFSPTLDSSNNPEILYKQTRYRSGDTDLVQADGTVDLGDVTGTAVPSYYSGITGMGYVEDTVTSIFDNVDVGVAETASEHISGITYSATLKIDPDTAGKWYGTTSATHTVTTDTVDKVNAEIKALRVHPTEEANADFDILYSHTRHITGLADTVHATDVNIGTVTGTAATEYAYGTANGNIQYHVPEAHLQGIDTSAYNSATGPRWTPVPGFAHVDQEDIDNWEDELNKMFSPYLDVTLTPKQLTLNQNLVYQRPINITDVSPNSQYKIIFSGGTLLTTVGASLSVMDTGWQTIPDINLILDNGLYVTGINDTNNNYPSHGAIHTANFTIHRKTNVGVETQISNGQLTYSFLTGAKLYHYDKSTRSEIRIDHKAVGETVTLDVNYYDGGFQFWHNSPTLGNNDQLRVKASDGSAWGMNDMITARIDNDAASNGTSSSEYSWTDFIEAHYWPSNSPFTYSNNFRVFQAKSDHKIRTQATMAGWDTGGPLTGNGAHFEPTVRTTGITASENIGLYLWTGWGVKFKSGNQQNHSDYTLALSATGS